MLVYSVCARKGRGGIVTGLGMSCSVCLSVCLSCFFFLWPAKKLIRSRLLGDHGNLFVTMTAQTGVLSE